MGKTLKVRSSPGEPGIWKRVVQYKYLYLLMLPGILFFLVFSYLPMVGIGIAFREFSFRNPFFGGDWVGFHYFSKIFNSRDFANVMRNTIMISLGRILFEFPFPIILAVLFNEIRGRRGKRFLQTVYSFPHFISWVVAAGVLINLLADGGAVNQMIVAAGGEKIGFLTMPSIFRPILFITNNWKEVGWGTIIYLATIASIDEEQYEAAIVDGANRWQRIWRITVPFLLPVIGIMLILQIANLMDAGFDQIFNMYNPTVYNVSDIVDTYIYRKTFKYGESFSASTAFGLFKSVISAVLLITANRTVKRFNNGSGVF